MRHKCLAAFIVFLLFLSISAFISVAQMRMILNAKFIGTFLEKAQIFSNFQKINELIADTTPNEQTKMAILTFGSSIEPNWLEQEFDTNLPAFFGYLNGNRQKLDLVIDTTPIKAKLPADWQKTANQALESLPACTANQKPNEENAPPCLDAGTRANLLTLSKMPEKINLADYVKNPDEVFGQFKFAFKMLKYWFWGSLFFSLIMIGLLVLLGRGYWPSIPRWIGVSLVIPSGFSLLSFLGMQASQAAIMARISSNLKPEILTIVSPILKTFSQGAFNNGLILAGSIFLVGWILIILSYALPHPPEPKPAKNAAVAPAAPKPAEAK